MNVLTGWLLSGSTKRKHEDNANDDTIGQSPRYVKKQRRDGSPRTTETVEESEETSTLPIRRQVLDHVDIPVYRNSSGVTNRRVRRSASPEEIKYDNVRPPREPSQSSSSDEQSLKSIDASGRSHRRTARRSYKGLDPTSDDSDFEPARARPSKRKKKTIHSNASSDFEDTGSSIDDADGLSDATEGSSITSPTEASSADESVDVKKTSKKKPMQRKADTPLSNVGDNTQKRKPSNKRMLNLTKRVDKLPTNQPPLHNIKDIFHDITQKSLENGLDKALEVIQSRPLRVATMCSGTESPLLALDLVRDALKTLRPNASLEIEHIFSAEIVPYKQAYIERNFAPPIIFRDIAEFIEAVKQPEPHATTAYGAEVPIPGDPDIVVAGTSCVDFSNLNNKKKGLGDGGESDLTWHGALSYCRTYRPSIVIFENVQSADWDKMLEMYEGLGYTCQGVHLDTKAFYIPHTRNRGYMVCFDTSRQQKTGSGLIKAWVELIEKLKRPASSPASAFLIPNDQVIVRQSVKDKDEDKTREVDWAVCEVTQMQYRQEDFLGNARPFTHWQESGTLLPPERGNGVWYHAQVERVLDTLDCCVLRKALPPPLSKKMIQQGKKSPAKSKRSTKQTQLPDLDENDQKQADKGGMYDVRYKTRIWDLSQNVYRNKDVNPFGIAGCITPSGQFFISDAGRAMAPEETLIFQGLPLHKINFTTESAREVQDLAGNAMTSTVVGSTILAALIVGRDLLKRDGDRVIAKETERPTTVSLVGQAEDIVRSSVSAETFDVPSILLQASQAARKCYCESTTGICDKDLQICLDCSHTCCVRCASNPEHRYASLPPEQRVAPEIFEATLRKHLPLVLKFPSSISREQLSAECQQKNQKLLTAYVDAVYNAATATYRFSHIRRTHCWTIIYSTASSHGQLELVIEADRAEWRLFAIPPIDLPIEHQLRTSLVQPIAKSVIKNRVNGDEWQWRVLRQEEVDLDITGEGDKVPTWWARIELPQFTQHKQWQQLRITTSTPCSDLGVDIDGLYEYLPACGTACEGLYKRVEPASTKPLYMFLDPTRTGHPDRDQYIFSHNHEDLEYHERRPVVASIAAPWRPWAAVPKFVLPKDAAKLPSSFKAKMPIRWKWISAKQSFGMTTPNLHIVMHKPDVYNLPAEALSCNHTALLMNCEVPNDSLQLHGDEPNKAKDIEFLQDNAWMLEAMRRDLPDSEWVNVQSDCTEDACAACAPAPPDLRWRLAKDTLIPFEDTESAAKYERSIKSRPDPLIMRLDRREEFTSVQFGLNIASLAHRVTARLPTRLECGPVSMQWQLHTSPSSASFVMKPFKLRPTTGVKPCSPKQDMTVNLFPKQALALAWMKQQEEGVKFMLEESEEATLPGVKWRAEVRAQKSIEIRGGICADHPGFGKTITSLALAHSDFRAPSDASKVVKQLEERQKSLGCEGLIPTAATLIVCPKTLVHQWAAEARDKLGYRQDQVLEVTDLGKLSTHTIGDIEQARLVIVNRQIFNRENYTERLAALAGVPGPTTTNGRTYLKWLQYATIEVQKNVGKLRSDGLTKLRKHVQDEYQRRVRSEEFETYVPSKRLRGKALVEAATQKAKGTKSKGTAAATLDTTNLNKPLIEMFFFNRMIVDEFHQCETREFAAIIALHADKRWGLSATPAMDDFYEISQTARLLDIPLRYGSDSRTVLKAKTLRSLRREMTAFERFDAHRATPSNMVYERIWEMDQLFLDTFVRRNIADHAHLPFCDSIRPVTLDLDHRVFYTELSQHLNSSDMRIKKGKNKNGTERGQRLLDSVEGLDDAEDALSLKAAVLLRQKEGYHGMKSLIDKSTAECKSWKAAVTKLLHAASKEEPEPFAGWVGIRITAGTLGDQIAVDYIQGQLRAQGIKVQVSEVQGDTEEKSEKKANGKRVCTSELNKAANALVVSQRSLRFYENVERLQQITSGKETLEQSCHNPGCNGNVTSTNDLAVSAYCGHVICKDCFSKNHAKQCVSDACSTRMDATQLLWVNKMGDLQQTKTAPYGQKISSVIELLKKLRNSNDQAIIFVQYWAEIKIIEEALERANVKALVIGEKDIHATETIKTFREDSSNTVLVLNSRDETAAGLNLQHANHVIFFSPLLRDTQYLYESTMAQAVGRVKRYGQKKQIYIYRIVALHTIDVDILEHRERRTTALTEMEAPEINPPSRADDQMDLDTKPQRTQLVKEGEFYSLRPRDWLLGHAKSGDGQETQIIKKRDRVHGWEDFSSLVKWSKAYTEDDDDD